MYSGDLYDCKNLLFQNVDNIWSFDLSNFFAITRDNVILPITNKDSDIAKFLNNKNYKYKKIVTTVLEIAALTYDGIVIGTTSCEGNAIDVS